MKLKNRLSLVVVLFMSAFVACYSLLVLTEVPERADAETAGSLPWVLDLLPDTLDGAAPPPADLRPLVRLVDRLEKIRHVRVALRTPDGKLLASTPVRDRASPAWLAARLSPTAAPLRKDVTHAGRVIAYFEVSPATEDELAELWEDFVRSTLLVVALSLVAMALIVWFTFKSLKPLDRVRDALRAVAAGQEGAQLPAFGNPEMDEIAASFNRMADAQATYNSERRHLLRKLIDADENTRRSVAHDLHDELSPYLVALQPLVRTLQMRCADRPGLHGVSETIDTLIHHQSHILVKLREILMGLHPPELHTLGLRGAVERMTLPPLRNEAGEQIELVLRPGGTWQSFGPTMDVSLYRLLQECLTNVRRHAAGARADVAFDLQAKVNGRAAVRLQVTNDCGPSPSVRRGGGLGVIGMRDRCIALGGSFEAGPVEGGRWSVSICLPVDVESAPLANRVAFA